MAKKSPYDDKAKDYCEKYEALDFETVHKDVLPFIPKEPSRVLDIGAGSGRDSAWFASKGHEVVAVEPSKGMLVEAQKRHKDTAGITWVNDGMPDLEKVMAKDKKFDYIHLSAVWMHVKPQDRTKAFANLNKLLAPGGQMGMSLRFGTPDKDRNMYKIDVDQMKQMAKANGLEVTFLRDKGKEDLQKRSDVNWGQICFKKGREREEQNKSISPAVMAAKKAKLR